MIGSFRVVGSRVVRALEVVGGLGLVGSRNSEVLGMAA